MSNTEESLRELYRSYEHRDPQWVDFCSGCGALFEVEALPPGHPAIQTGGSGFDFKPDLEGFYEKVVGRALNA